MIYLIYDFKNKVAFISFNIGIQTDGDGLHNKQSCNIVFI